MTRIERNKKVTNNRLMKKKDFASAGRLSGKRMGTLLCAATFLLCGCGNENEMTEDGRVPLQVNAGIQTRAYNNLWQSGDAIGIYMLKEANEDVSNRKYTTTATADTKDGTFSATEGDIYFPVDGSGRDFIAYYPYQAGITDGNYIINLKSQSAQKDIDLMRSEKVLGKDKDHANVAFKFYHKLAKIEVNIEAGTGLTVANLAETKVSLTNQPVKGTFSLLAEGAAATADAITEANPLEELTFCTTADGSKYEAIVFPAAKAQLSDMVMKFLVPKVNKTIPFTFSMKDAAKTESFEAGKKYLYTITVNKIGLSVTSTIDDWSAGNGAGDTGSAE